MYRACHLDGAPESHIRGNEEIEYEKKVERNERGLTNWFRFWNMYEGFTLYFTYFIYSLVIFNYSKDLMCTSPDTYCINMHHDLYIFNEYVCRPYQSIYTYKFLVCQEPDLNWWHEDFQSSALPAELSRPLMAHHPHSHFMTGFKSMSIKKKDEKGITKSYL